jgi:hypothetical protein
MNQELRALILEDEMKSLAGWATICRSGTDPAPHSHPDSASSGVYYMDAFNATMLAKDLHTRPTFDRAVGEGSA